MPAISGAGAEYDPGGPGILNYYNAHTAQVGFKGAAGNLITALPAIPGTAAKAATIVPWGYTNGAYVEKGSWLGFIAGDGGFSPHVQARP